MSTTNWPRTDSEITFSGSYTCTHHNDGQRAACPVCLVSWIAAERDQLRTENERLRRAYVRPDDIRAQLESAIARAARAEDNLAALEQCHDDNCRGVVKIAAELAAERARLDWVFRNCKVTGDDYWIHDREDLGAAMKEDAK